MFLGVLQNSHFHSYGHVAMQMLVHVFFFFFRMGDRQNRIKEGLNLISI